MKQRYRPSQRTSIVVGLVILYAVIMFCWRILPHASQLLIEFAGLGN